MPAERCTSLVKFSPPASDVLEKRAGDQQPHIITTAPRGREPTQMKQKSRIRDQQRQQLFFVVVANSRMGGDHFDSAVGRNSEKVYCCCRVNFKAVPVCWERWALWLTEQGWECKLICKLNFLQQEREKRDGGGDERSSSGGGYKWNKIASTLLHYYKILQSGIIVKEKPCLKAPQQQLQIQSCPSPACWS